ncbi:hypothetical protein DASC09_030030 [Saccharomycopsis crataegensis]|uniref:F-box domain-containing protein n=1 Tax=Saccharomycopsis crataegensis TaxID=43959 RepID=A0AAV5QLL3_9ASCO|nr:hypothetical protein DASC09_030030 [Saccharomycopsis crataegensis]
MGKVSIYTLPAEVLVEVFGYLDTHTLETVASISRYLDDIINNDYIWRILFIKKLIKDDDLIALDALPGKRKSLKHQTTMNTDNIVERNSRIITSFPSLSLSWHWKTEFMVRFTYIKKLMNINKNKKVSNPKDLKKSHFRKLNPYLLTTVYKVHSNYLIDDLVCDFGSDKLILYSHKTHNLNFLSLKQGKKIYQVDSHISRDVLAEHSLNQVHYATVEKITKNLIMIGNSNGLIFMKLFTNDFALSSPSNSKFFNKHTWSDEHVPSVDHQRLAQKKLFISSIVLNPLLNSSVGSFGKGSLDVLSGDLLGQVYGWNYITKAVLFKIDINESLNDQDIQNLDRNIRFPVLKIATNFKEFVVVESINQNFFIIKFDGAHFTSHSIKHIRLDQEVTQNAMILHEIFNANSVHLVNEINPVFLGKIVNPRSLSAKSYMEVDYANEKIVYSWKNKINLLDFDGYKSAVVNTSLKDDPVDPQSAEEYVMQTKIINNLSTRRSDGNKLAGNDSSLHVALFSSGKVVVHATANSDQENKNVVVFKVIPSFLSDLCDGDPYSLYHLHPILKFDCNSGVLLLCSYNGWMAIVNILNGCILKIIEHQIPKTLTNTTPYNIEFHRQQAMDPGAINVAPSRDPVVATNNFTLVPVTAVELAPVPAFSAEGSDEGYSLPPILLRGLIVLDNIVQYFHISFENSLFVRNTLGLTEEELLLSKQLKKKQTKQSSRLQTWEKIRGEMDEFENDNYESVVQGKLFDKYNGVHDLDDEEELMLALAMSESVVKQAASEQDKSLKQALELSKIEEGIMENNDDDEEEEEEEEFDDDLRRALELSALESKGPQNDDDEMEFSITLDGEDEMDDDLRMALELSALESQKQGSNNNNNNHSNSNSNGTSGDLADDMDEDLRKALELSALESQAPQYNGGSGIQFRRASGQGLDTTREEEDEFFGLSKEKFKFFDNDDLENGEQDDGDDDDDGDDKGKQTIDKGKSANGDDDDLLDEDMKLAIKLSKLEYQGLKSVHESNVGSSSSMF